VKKKEGTEKGRARWKKKMGSWSELGITSKKLRVVVNGKKKSEYASSSGAKKRYHKTR